MFGFEQICNRNDKIWHKKMKKIFFLTDALNKFSIIRMKEHKSYIIVTEEFKNICEKSNLKGIRFLSEGDSIYTNV